MWNKQWEKSWVHHPKNERQKLFFVVEVKGNIEMKIERRERKKKKKNVLQRKNAYSSRGHKERKKMTGVTIHF